MKQVTLQIEDGLAQRIEDEAKLKERSMAGQIRFFLRQGMSHLNPPEPQAENEPDGN